MENERLERQIAFCREIDKEKQAGRLIWQTVQERKTMLSTHGIWQL